MTNAAMIRDMEAVSVQGAPAPTLRSGPAPTEELRALLSALASHAAVFTADGRYIHSNRSAEVLFEAHPSLRPEPLAHRHGAALIGMDVGAELLLPMALSHGFPANDEHGTRSVRFLISLVKGAMPNLEFILMEIAKPRDTLRRWVERASAVARARALVGEAVASIASALEAKDPYTAGHQRRVASLAVAIARTLGLGDDSVEAVRVAGLVHDIGKIGLLSELLCKPGKLMEAELALLRTHAAVGARILGHIDFGAPIARIVHQRHERLDGSGYPKGLEGDEILLEARIIAVADAVEAIASDRPYRPAMVLGAALYHIVDGRCVLFEGGAVDACIVVLARPEAPPEGWRT